MKKENISLVKSFILGYGLAAIQWQTITKVGWLVIASQAVLLLAVYYPRGGGDKYLFKPSETKRFLEDNFSEILK